MALKLTKYSDFDRPSNVYESMVNSGEIQFLKNEKVIEKVQFLEESYMYFNRMEEIHYDLILSIVPNLIPIIKFSNRDVKQVDELYNYKFQNILVVTLGIMREKDVVYKRAKSEMLEIIKLIDEELE